jgi:3-isopropylmalate/(R)-2-methylmalate dehydratase small subunit
MRPVTTVSGRAYPWGAKNVDTDVIIPAHWLKTITRTGLGRGAFETIRAQPGNLFDDPEFAGSPILIAGDNFGCGSSREHAAWALADMGITAVVLPQAAVDRLVEVAKTDPVTIDLESMTVTTPFQDRFTFELDPFRRQCLIEGLDEVGLTLARDTAISKFEEAVVEHRPWLERKSGYAGIAVDGAGRT